MVSTADLPTVGSISYGYVGGVGATLAPTSYLLVNFGTATMDATLNTVGFGSWTASAQPIADFYGSGVTLNSGGQTGSFTGRFVGSGAAAAMTAFILDLGGSFATGAAAFAH